jgi:hypothetical protein
MPFYDASRCASVLLDQPSERGRNQKVTLCDHVISWPLDPPPGEPPVRLNPIGLDINLKGQVVFPVTGGLREQGVPFVFAIG